MAKTKRDVITEALTHIQVCDVAEGPSGEDYARTERVFDGVFAQLDEIQQVGIPFTEQNIPEWAFLPLSRMVAGRVADSFNVPQYRAEYASGLRELRAYVANETRVAGAPTQADYY